MRPDWRRVALWLTVLAGAFTLLAAAVTGAAPNPRLIGWDQAATQWAQLNVGPGARQVWMWVSDMGDTPLLTALVIAVALWLLRRRERALAAIWLLSCVANSLSMRVLKAALGRARPDGAAQMVTSGLSFPSGHSAGSVMVYGLLLWLLWPRVHGAARIALAVSMSALVSAILVSRVLLQAHFLSDVVGGALLAAIWLVLAVALARWTRADDAMTNDLASLR